MLARDLASAYPIVRMDTQAMDAARLLAEQRLPGLIVLDDREHPTAVLPGSQVLRFLIPRYVQDDPALARVLDEGFADRMCDSLQDKTVADLLPRERVPLPVVSPDDTALEIAAIMAANRSPVVAVVEGHGRDTRMVGAITTSQLLGRLLPEKSVQESS